jgi:hypothetical protein
MVIIVVLVVFIVFIVLLLRVVAVVVVLAQWQLVSTCRLTSRSEVLERTVWYGDDGWVEGVVAQGIDDVDGGSCSTSTWRSSMSIPWNREPEPPARPTRTSNNSTPRYVRCCNNGVVVWCGVVWW